MSLTQEQIEKLSKNLSKIKLDNEKLGQDINGILKYIDLLNEVDTTGIKPTISVVEKENILRDDVEIRTINPKDLLACSNQKVIANQIAVSNIMK
ncbi:MAG: Asp-tRNA(Asn)/Glu-tRNA(Gln) amidotransferase subunit GatC [Candidatus Gracilibacteria bacterium]|nr:Asp-tRNA(Asn)/Glu-tRNA(Gln) amidotransferase subunit GatC [Candidatus Gracilibacteria bacterium]